MRPRWVGLMIAVTAGGAFGLLQLVSSSASAASGTATQRVIVIFRNQDPSQPASGTDLGPREATFRASRAAAVSQMAASGARDVHAYNLIDAVSATVTRAEVARLRSDPSVSQVVPDVLLPAPEPTTATAGTSASSASSSSAVKPPAHACDAPGKVQLGSQAIETIAAASDVKGAKTARSLGITGAGVKVAFLADGLDTDEEDFIRADGKPVFVDYKDFSGDGTGAPTGGLEAFLDASSIAAQGRATYNLADNTARPLSRPCDIRIEGAAPGASLVGLDVFGTYGGFASSILEAIDYAVTVDHVNVMNESFGDDFYPADEGALDAIEDADNAAVAAGTVVTVSSGDESPTNTIGTPASDPHVISAAASTTLRGVAQIEYGLPGWRFSGWLNDNVSTLSSSGFDQTGRTVDLVAPGDSNWIPCVTDTNTYGDCFDIADKPATVVLVGGTSESAPLTAGVSALVIQAYRKTHHGSTPSPKLVKQLILSTTDDIGSPADQQGTGRLDAYKAVLAAESVNGGHGRRAAGTSLVLDGRTQLNAVAAPGTSERFRDTITNASRRKETLYLHTRTLGSYRELTKQAVEVSDNTSVHFIGIDGARSNFERLTFRVPKGENRLSASIAYPDVLGASPPELDLIDPSGRVAANYFLTGDSDYENAQVTDPEPGKWRALLSSPMSNAGGYVGNVIFEASAAHYTRFGTVTPSRVTLASGRSAHVVLRTRTPRSAGDASGSIVVSAHRGVNGSDDADNEAGPTNVTSVPVTLRSVVPSGKRRFTATTTGGNASAPEAGQTFYYELEVPAHSPELNASVTLPEDPYDTFQAYLVNPQGEAEAFATNVWFAQPFSDFPGPATVLTGANLNVLTPKAGRWTLIIVFAPAASGNEISQRFTVTTSEAKVVARGNGLPDSASTTLTPGTAHTYTVALKNTGTAPGLYFADARLAGHAKLALGALEGADTTVPLTASANLPFYLVPTDTTSLAETARTSGSEPIQFDSNDADSDPDIASSVGTTARLTFRANPVPSGAWDIAPVVSGVFGATGAPSEPVATGASVITQPFDSSVSTGTGDVEADSVDPASTLPSFRPVAVQPGKIGRLKVTITPTGAAGTQHSGTLYLDEYYDSIFTFSEEPDANQVAAIPYRYTVK